METCKTETSASKDATTVLKYKQWQKTQWTYNISQTETYEHHRKFYIVNLSRQKLHLTPLSKTLFSTQYSYNFNTQQKSQTPTKQAIQSSIYTHNTDKSYHVTMIHKTQLHHFRQKREDDLLRSKHVLKTTHYHYYIYNNNKD